MRGTSLEWRVDAPLCRLGPEPVCSLWLFLYVVTSTRQHGSTFHLQSVMPQIPLSEVVMASEAGTAWVAVYLVASSVNWFCFGCNRAMLLISRTVNVEWNRVAEMLAPAWYLPLSWLTTIAKLLSLIAVAFTGGFVLAGGLWFVQFVASVLLPIPYKTFYAGPFNRAVHSHPLHPDRLRAQLWLKECGFGEMHTSQAEPAVSKPLSASVDSVWASGTGLVKTANEGEWCDICNCSVFPDDDNRCPGCKWPL